MILNLNAYTKMKDLKRIYILNFLFFVLAAGYAQRPSPGTVQLKAVYIRNATIHTGTGTVIENGNIVFENGIIRSLGKEAYNGDAEIIDGTGKHVYPGFILPNTVLGLTEIDAVKATRDFDETGELNPEARALVAYNTDSKIIPTVRFNGVLLCQPVLRGGMISGTSSVMQLDAWNWEDAAVLPDDGVHMQWPAVMVRGGWWAEQEAADRNKKLEENVQKLKDFFRRAAVYDTLSPEKDLKLHALRRIFNGEQRLYVQVQGAWEARQAVLFFSSVGVKNLVLKAGGNIYEAAGILKEHHVPVILRRTHILPDVPDDPVDAPYSLPYKLYKAGVLFCLDYSGDMEAMGCRNLPFLAGTAAAYGIPPEEALKLITLNTAKILGIDARYGSLEPGKSATLFMSEGDALDMKTNKLSHAFIDGRALQLHNHQAELNRMYLQKYGK